jgi:hypothetical protein
MGEIATSCSRASARSSKSERALLVGLFAGSDVRRRLLSVLIAGVALDYLSGGASTVGG